MNEERHASLGDYLEIVDAEVRTSRRASEIFFDMPPLALAIRGELLIRDDLNATYKGFVNTEPEDLDQIGSVSALKAEYWKGARHVTQMSGAYENAELDDYFQVGLDRSESEIRAAIRGEYEQGSPPLVLLDAIEAYATALNLDTMTAARIATKHLMYALPALKRHAMYAEQTTDVDSVTATRNAFQYFTDELVPTHIEKSLIAGQIVGHTRIEQTEAEAPEDLPPLVISAHDATGLTRVYKLERRPYSDEELVMANQLANEPVIQTLLLTFHLAIVDYSVQYLGEHPERAAHSLLPFSEFFVECPQGFVPNPKLLKVLCNNYLPALAGIMQTENVGLSGLTGEHLARAAVYARKRRVFFAQIAKFNNYDQETDTVELDAFIGRICPGMQALTNGLTAWLPKIYDQLTRH